MPVWDLLHDVSALQGMQLVGHCSQFRARTWAMPHPSGRTENTNMAGIGFDAVLVDGSIHPNSNIVFRIDGTRVPSQGPPFGALPCELFAGPRSTSRWELSGWSKHRDSSFILAPNSSLLGDSLHFSSRAEDWARFVASRADSSYLNARSFSPPVSNYNLSINVGTLVVLFLAI